MNGCKAARKFFCSCAVESPQTSTEPPILAPDVPELEDDVGVLEPHAVASPRRPAVTTANLPSVLTCVIEVLLTGANLRPAPNDPVREPPVYSTGPRNATPSDPFSYQWVIPGLRLPVRRRS